MTEQNSNFLDQWHAHEPTVQAAAAAYEALPDATPSYPRPSGRRINGEVQTRRADPQVWAEVRDILAAQGGYADIQIDGSVIIRNNPPTGR